MTESERENQPKPEGNAPSDHPELSKKHCRLSVRHPDPIVRLTAWIAVFTFLLTVVAGLQVWVGVKSDRAFLAPSHISFVKFPEPRQETVDIRIDIQNSGKRTAIIEEVNFVITHSLAKIPRYSGAQKVVFPPVSAGGTSRTTGTFEIGWDESTTAKVREGKTPFFIYGVIKYSDGYNFFGLSKTGFCYVYRPSGFETCQQHAYTYNK